MSGAKKYPGLQARGNSAIGTHSILQNAETGKPTIYRANCGGNATNTEYPHRVDSYFEGDKYDCVFAEYKDGIRSNKNFIQSNVLLVDVDGGRTIVEFQAEFAGTRFELVTSKSHDKPKGSEPSCNRFHAVFYLDRMVTGIDEYTRLKDAFVRVHPYCDKGAKDGARFFYGNRAVDKKRFTGEGEPLCADAILAEAKNADSVMPAAPQDYTRTARYAPPSVLYEGGRNAGLYKAACSLLAKHDDTPEAKAAYNAIRCEPELPQGERDGIYARAQAHHAERKARGEWKPSANENAAYTLGISREAVQDGGEHAALFEQAESVLNGRQWQNLLPVESTAVSALTDAVERYVLHDGNGWLVYNELRGLFERDPHTPYLLAGFAATSWLVSCTSGRTPQSFNFVKTLDGNKGRRAVLASLSHVQGIVCEPAEFDKLTYMLNCAGIAVDLRTSERRPAKPADSFTQSTNCRPEAGETPETDKFLAWCACGDAELTAYLWRLFGYCLTGETKEQCFWNFHGNGGNGKGTLLRLTRKAMGDYAGAVPDTLILKSRDNRFDRECLVGLRLAIGEDIGSGTLDLPFIKALTGGDEVKIEAKHQNAFMYRPVATLIYSSNTQLWLNETGKAVDRRVRCVPFNAHVETPDYGLEARLAAEASQVLHRLIQEAKAWYQADKANLPRFPPCSAVDHESKAYTESQNIALEFVNECCEVADGERMPGKDIYSPAYTEWCKKSGARPVGKQVFFKALQDGGFSMKKGSGHARFFERLRLKQ